MSILPEIKPVDQVLAIGVKLADQLKTAHEAGMLHQDIRPTNILFDDAGQAMLAAPSPYPPPEAILWKAPEAFGSANPATEQADVWSLAATLYSLLTGRAPYQDPNPDFSKPIAPLARFEYIPLGRPDAPPELDQVLRTALAKQPGSRYPTARAFRNALMAVQAQLAAGAPVVAPKSAPVPEPATPTPEPPVTPSPESVPPVPPAAPPPDYSAAQPTVALDTPPTPTLKYAVADEVSLGGEVLEQTIMRSTSEELALQPPKPKRGKGRRKPILAIAGGLAVVIIAGLLIWLKPWEGAAPTASPSASVPPAATPTETATTDTPTEPAASEPVATPEVTPTAEPAPEPTAVTPTSPLQVGTVYSWGSAKNGLLGDGTEVARETPGPITELTGVIAVAAGEDYQDDPWDKPDQGYAYALLGDGTIYAWGANKYGQLGVGTTQEVVSPKQVKGVKDAVGVAAACGSAYALHANGTVSGWGQWPVGNGRESDQLEPVKLSGLKNVTQVAPSCATGFALTQAGNVYAWGWYTFGVGSGTPYAKTPKKIAKLSDIKQISAGCSSAYALKADGTVVAWGGNAKAQLGDGGKKDHANPVAVEGLTNIVQIAATCDAAYALDASGQVWGWGSNPAVVGGLVRTPVVVGSSVTKLQAGYSSVFASWADGTLFRGDPGAAWAQLDAALGATDVAASAATTFVVKDS
ncbi:MAG: hypothetical protein LBR20_04195 [Propionibacteriaceae bacterium]|jgi:hypothetical protein|nr:hypothetical protein [Propionibacteriaceae bacterium]